MRQRRESYTTEQDARIMEMYEAAKREGLDMAAVYATLSEEMGRTPKGIMEHCRILRNGNKPIKRRKRPKKDVSLVDMVQAVITERDDYKQKYEALLAEHNELKRVLSNAS